MKYFKNLILGAVFLIIFSGINISAVNASFTDVYPSHPNYTAIEYLEQKGILQGYSDGTFKPSNAVNRVEALKIILLANKTTIQNANGSWLFSDTPAGSWYSDYLNTAKNLGIIKGYDDGTFKPAQTVALVENLKMALISANINTDDIAVEANMYADVQNQQSAWFAKYLQYAKRYQLIDADGSNRVFPAQGMTRGKLAELMYRIMLQKNISPSDPVVNDPVPTGGLVIEVDPTKDRKEISPYIYGSNILETGGNLFRLGGNRWTAYNWTNNASNAGTDWGPNSSDGYLSESTSPGQAVKEQVLKFFAKSADALITIPIVDYVSADKNGLVYDKALDSNKRWIRNLAQPDSFYPNGVRQDLFLQWLKAAFKDQLAQGRKIFISLDNEPGLWSSTHPLVHSAKVTYEEIAERSIRFAKMIKDVMPDTLVFGAVSYGFNEFETLQDAPDKNGRNYVEYFLSAMKTAEDQAGKRLVDVLDLHWYPEARGGGRRITENNGADQSKGEIEARLQAPRSLWDQTYVEDSWISKDYLGNKPVNLLSYIKSKIDNKYPGTKMSFTEYNYGGANHISGALAQADVLGIFGKYGVFAANYWPLSTIDQSSYIQGAFDLFLNYDGKGARVGTTSILATNPNTHDLSVYGFSDSSNKYYLLVINKTSSPQSISSKFKNIQNMSQVNVYQLTSASLSIKAAESITVVNNQINYSLPAMGATLFVVK
ncbi:MAG: glycoside hydrolase family 44 protein [Candidatus Gracilibacteria bacterium]